MWQKVWTWIKTNVKLLLTILAFVLFFIFFFIFKSKVRTIRRLEGELYATKAKIKLEKIAAKYDVTLVELKDLKKKDKEVEKEIFEIEKNLENKLKEDMTAEEIAEKFRELGIR